jgi:phosphoenolpyruvate carboxykinase (GTP)
VPAPGALNVDGLDVSAEDLELLTSVDDEAVKAELDQVREHLATFGDKLPAAITRQLDALEQRLG